MFRDAPVIDADAHKVEHPLVFPEFVDLPARDRIVVVGDAAGRAVWQIDDVSAAGGRRARRFPALAGAAPGVTPFADGPTALGALYQRVRRAEMDREGVDVQVLYPTLALSFSELLDLELAVALCRGYNDYIAAECAAAPTRLVPVGVVPAQDVAAATEEMRRCVVDLGMPAVVLPPAVPRPHPAAADAYPTVSLSRSLADPAFAPFFETAEFLDATIAIHPVPAVAPGGCAADVLVEDLLERRSQVQRALAQLIVHGVLERHSRLRFGFVDAGGGWLPDFAFGLCARWARRAAIDAKSVFASGRFLIEALREGGGGGLLTRRRGVRDLRANLGAPPPAARDAIPPGRNPEEYFARGQIFVTCAPDDPAPIHLRQAFGPVGERLACWSAGYGVWNGVMDDAVQRTSGNAAIGLDYVARLLSTNALRLYGERFRKRIAPGFPASGVVRAREEKSTNVS